MSSPLSLSSRSSSRSSSFSDVSRSDEPCQAAFAVRPPISICRIVLLISHFTDRRNSLGARWADLARRARHLARVPEVLRSTSLSLSSSLPPFHLLHKPSHPLQLTLVPQSPTSPPSGHGTSRSSPRRTPQVCTRPRSPPRSGT